MGNPAHMTFAEGIFAMPLLHHFKHQVDHRFGIWISYLHGHMRRMLSYKPKGYTFLGTDWNSFDASIPAWLIRDAFAILYNCFDMSKYQVRGAPTDPDTLPRLWKQIVRYFINTPIKMPDGRVFVKSRGVPSGSYFTSLVNSVCNCIVMHYLLLRSKVAYSQRAFWVLGDDSLIAFKGNLVVNDLAAIALSGFGMMLNGEKSEISDFPSFLGFGLHYSGVPQSKYDKLMAQLCLPSRLDRSLDELASRVRALQLASFGGNKRFLYETQSWLESIGLPDPPDLLSSRSEFKVKLESLNLHGWPPLSRVLIL